MTGVQTCALPISVGDAVLAAVQEVDLIKPLPVAHLHDFGLEVAQGSVGTAGLATGFCVEMCIRDRSCCLLSAIGNTPFSR